MQATIKALQKQVQDAKAEAAAATTAADSANGSDLDLKVKWKGAPEFSSGDGKFKMKVRGRLEVGLQPRRSRYGDYQLSGRERHRAQACPYRRRRRSLLRLEICLEVDFANDAIRVKDAFLQYQGFKVDDEPDDLQGRQF